MKEKQPSSKTILKREQQKAALIEAAETVIAEQGIEFLKARDLADRIGIALGGIYNLIGDLDELVLLVGSKTLQRLENTLTKTIGDRDADTDGADMLVLIAQCYHHFARDNYNLWNALFDPHIANDKTLPEWVSQDRMRPFHFVEKPLRRFMPHSRDHDIALFAQTLFSAIHGIVRIGLDSRDVGVRQHEIDGQIDIMMRLILKGLQQSQQGK